MVKHKKTVNYDKLILLPIAVFCILLIIYNRDAAICVQKALSVSGKNLIPSLYPFLFVSAFMSKTRVFCPPKGKADKLLRKYLRLSYTEMSLFIMNCIGGYPVSAKAVTSLVNDGKITKNQGERILLFCVNPSIAFVLNTIGMNVYNSRETGIVLFAGTVLSNLIIGIITSYIYNDEQSYCEKGKKVSFSEAFSLSGREASCSMMNICGFYIFFSVFSFCVKKLVAVEAVSNIIAAAAEITNGVFELYHIYPVFIICGMCTFGSFCVHCQIIEDIKNTGLKYSVFIFWRIISSLLSIIICFCLIKIFPKAVEAANMQSTRLAFADGGYITGVFFLLSTVVFLLGDITLEKKKKPC